MPDKKLIIGLTGGIGSGKSEVSRRFAALGIEIVDADLVARDVVIPGTDALAFIADHFGPDILLTDGSLNRARLRDIIFADIAEKEWLENLLHPLINQRISESLAQSRSAYVILSSPLLLETKQYLLVNRVLVVDTSEIHQIERASRRDAKQEAQIRAIMATQLSRAERCSRATDIIQNHADLDELDEQIARLHKLYMELAEPIN
jgi:dephospho-CoA kinase